MPIARERQQSGAGSQPPEHGADGAALRARARALEPILQTISDGIAVVDRQGRFLVFNEAAQRILGVGMVEAPPTAWPETYGLFLPDRVTPYPFEQLPLVRAVQGEAVRDVEIFVRNASLSEGAVISVTAMPWRDPSGELLGAVAVFRDVTAQKDAGDALRRLSSAVEQTADAVYVTDREGVIEYVNPGFELMTGYTSAEVLGRTPRVLRSGRHDAAHYRGLWKTLLAGRVFRGTMVNQRKDGSIYYAEMTITPIKDSSGAVTHHVAVGKDMTDRLARQAQELELNLARSVQRSLFPSRPPHVPGFDIAGDAHAATAMCGDYFDFVVTGDGRLGIAVGDVSGHGVGPALVMAETRAYLRAYLDVIPGVAGVLRALNRMLAADLGPGSFVTMLLAGLDAHTRSLTYASAGHPPGFVLARDGRLRVLLESTGMPLGIAADCCVQDADPITLDPGDVVVLLTDGITESRAPDGTLLGIEGAQELVRAHLGGSARQVLDGLIAGVRAHEQDGSQEDDLTAVVCRVTEEA